MIAEEKGQIMTKGYQVLLNTMQMVNHNETAFNDVWHYLIKSRVNEILAEETGYKNTLYFCTEDDALLTLSDLFHDFLICERDYLEYESFKYWLDCATDMSGSLREIQSVRHYLYYINYSIETETNYITVSLDTASADGQLF